MLQTHTVMEKVQHTSHHGVLCGVDSVSDDETCVNSHVRAERRFPQAFETSVMLRRSRKSYCAIEEPYRQRRKEPLAAL